MARRNLNNGDSGLVYRTKLNDNFIEIFRSSSEAQISASMYSAYIDKVNYFTGSQYFDVGTGSLNITGTTIISGSVYISGSINFQESQSITGLDYIDFNTDASPTHQEGRLHWNVDDYTLEVGLALGSVLQIGQEQLIRVFNKSGQTISNGQSVYLSGIQEDQPSVELASADYDIGSGDQCPSSSLVLGLATQDIEDQTAGFVTTFGLVRGLDTSNFDEGDVLFLNTGSEDGYSTSRTNAPDCCVKIGTVVRSHQNEGTILVEPDRKNRISYSPDVNARGNQSDGDILAWNDTNKYWDPVNTSSLYVSAATMNIASTSSITPTVTSSVSYEIDESNNKLYFHIVYGDGTVHSASADIF